jgi:hypothetical protein
MFHETFILYLQSLKIHTESGRLYGECTASSSSSSREAGKLLAACQIAHNDYVIQATTANSAHYQYRQQMVPTILAVSIIIRYHNDAVT